MTGIESTLPHPAAAILTDRIARRLPSAVALSVATHLALLCAFGWLEWRERSRALDAPEGRRGVLMEIVGSPAAPRSVAKPAPRPRAKPIAAAPTIAAQAPNSAAVPAEETATQPASGASGPVGVEGGRAASARERYLYELRALLESRLVYPLASKRLGETGTVLMRFKVQGDGRIEAAEISAPSPHARLNSAALELVSGLGTFKPIPDEIRASSPGPMSVELPVRYSLRGR